jgi:hypothetical protein
LLKFRQLLLAKDKVRSISKDRFSPMNRRFQDKARPAFANGLGCAIDE